MAKSNKNNRNKKINPIELLNQSGVAKALLSANTRESLGIYEEALADLKEFPENTSLIEIAEGIGTTTIELLEEDIAVIQADLKDEVEEEKAQKKRKAQSKRVVKKSEKSIDYLSECRAKLRADRKRKIEAG